MLTEAPSLFSKHDLGQGLAAWKQKIMAEINNLEANYVLNTSLDDLANYFAQEYRIDVPRLDEENIISDFNSNARFERYDNYSGRTFSLMGTDYIFIVPFQGDKTLFDSKPTNTVLNIRPRATIQENRLHFSYFLEYVRLDAPDQEMKMVQEQFASDLSAVRQYLDWITDETKPFYLSLINEARIQIEFQKKRHLRAKNIAESLGFPIKRRNEAETFSAPIVRKKLPISLPQASKEPFTPEPVLEMAEYEHILAIMSSMVMAMERSPKAFANMDEEDLRWLLLVPLNGHYEGQATGETFNFEGKTDILIRHNGKNVFIAECKIWKGKKVVQEAIDQLVGYASWRDTKTSIVVFSRNKDFPSVLKQIPEAVESHPNFKRKLNYNSETGFRYVIHQRDDKNREITLTVLAFDVPR